MKTQNPGIKIIHETHIRVRYGDTDKMGVVYNGNYFYYFEIGRTEMLRDLGLPYSQFEINGIMIPLTSSHAVYKIPALYDDLLTIRTTHIHSSAASPRFDYEILRGDLLLATGYTEHAYMNAETRRAVRPPKFFLDVLNYFTEHKEEFHSLKTEKA